MTTNLQLNLYTMLRKHLQNTWMHLRPRESDTGPGACFGFRNHLKKCERPDLPFQTGAIKKIKGQPGHRGIPTSHSIIHHKSPRYQKKNRPPLAMKASLNCSVQIGVANEGLIGCFVLFPAHQHFYIGHPSAS